MKTFATFGVKPTGEFEMIAPPSGDYDAHRLVIMDALEKGSSKYQWVRMVDLGGGTVKKRRLDMGSTSAPAAKEKQSKPKE